LIFFLRPLLFFSLTLWQADRAYGHAKYYFALIYHVNCVVYRVEFEIEAAMSKVTGDRLVPRL
jgi:hypothetical protein